MRLSAVKSHSNNKVKQTLKLYLAWFEMNTNLDRGTEKLNWIYVRERNQKYISFDLDKASANWIVITTTRCNENLSYRV